MSLQVINSAFSRLVHRTPGIHSILLVTDDGFPIVSTLESGDEEGLSTAVGAILTDAGVRSIQELKLGQLDVVICVGSDGYLLQKRLAQNATIMLIADPEVMLGVALARLKQALPDISLAYQQVVGGNELPGDSEPILYP